MRYLKAIIYVSYLYALLGSLSCSNDQRTNSIIPLSTLNNTDTIETGDTILIDKKESNDQQGKFILHRTEYFLVKGDTLQIKDQMIDSFLNENKSVDFDKFESYNVIFIKESTDINEKNIPSSANSFETPGFSVHKDFIYSYTWEKGFFKGKLKFENGKVVSIKKIE